MPDYEDMFLSLSPSLFGEEDELGASKYTKPGGVVSELERAGVQPRVGPVEPEAPPAFEGFNKPEVDALVKAVEGPGNVNEVKFADGTTIKNTPPPTLAPTEGKVKGGSPKIEGKKTSVAGGSLDTDVSFWDRLGAATQDPRFGYVMGEIGTALAPNEQLARFGQVGVGMAKSRAYGDYLDAVREGRTPSGSASILSTEEKNQAQAVVQGERLQAVRETQVGLEERRTELAEAAPEERRRAVERQENFQREMLDQTNLNRKELIEFQSKYGNKWMNIYGGIIHNWETGEVRDLGKGIREAELGKSLGKLPAAMYNKFEDAVIAEYLPQVYKRHNDKYKDKYGTIREFTEAIADPATGKVNYEVLTSYLLPEEREETAKLLAQYAMGQASGVDYTIQAAQRAVSRLESEQEFLVKPVKVDQADWDKLSPEERRRMVNYFNKGK